MINQFRTLNPVNLILMAFIAIILRIGLLLQLPETLPVNILEPFSKLMISFPEQVIISPLANVCLAACITFIQAMLVNKVVNDYNLLGKPSFLPALLFITASSLLTPFLTLGLPLTANFFIIWVTSKFLSLYRRDEARSVMYDLGMIVGAGTLIYFPFIAIMPLLWFSLIIFRPFNWREWIAALLGFITVYFFLAFFYYWNDSLNQFYRIWLPFTNKFVIDLKLNLYDYIVFVPVAITFVLALFSLQQHVFRGYVQTKKSYQVIFAMLVMVVVSFYLEPLSGVSHFLLGTLPASVFMAYYFSHARARWLYESLYGVLVGCIIYFQWF